MATQFRSVLNRRLFDYQRSSIKRGHKWELTKEEFASLITQECAYCGAKPKRLEFTVHASTLKDAKAKRRVKSLEKINGIDRKDNEIGYTLSNCVPCCSTCNFLKNMMSAKKFIAHILRIAIHRELFK